MFANELEFSIGIITLPLHILDTIVVNIMQTKKTTKTIKSIIKHILIPKGSGKIVLNKESKVSLKDKVYPETYHHHKPGQVHIDETPVKVLSIGIVNCSMDFN